MKIPRAWRLLFLVGAFVACLSLAEEEAPLPTAGLDAGKEEENAEEAGASKLGEIEQEADAAAAASQEVEADVLEEKVAQVEEEEEEEGGVEGSHDETASGGGDDADAAAGTETEGETEAAEETGAKLEEDEGVPAAAAAPPPAAPDRELGGEEEDDLESRNWRRRAAGRLDGFIDGWRGKGEGNPFKGALGSYDALLKEHYLKMSFTQVIQTHMDNCCLYEQTRLCCRLVSSCRLSTARRHLRTCTHLHKHIMMLVTKQDGHNVGTAV